MKKKNLAMLAIAGAGYGLLGLYSITSNYFSKFSFFNSSGSVGYSNSFQEFAGEYLTNTLFLPVKGLGYLTSLTGLDSVFYDIKRVGNEIGLDNGSMLTFGSAIGGSLLFTGGGLLVDLIRKKIKKNNDIQDIYIND